MLTYFMLASVSLTTTLHPRWIEHLKLVHENLSPPPNLSAAKQGVELRYIIYIN
jgi:hypothetical protein